MGSEVVKRNSSVVDNPPAIPADVTKMRVEDKLMGVAVSIHKSYDIVRVNNIGEYYWKEHEQHIYKHLDKHTLEIWARDCWISSYGSFKPKDINDAVETIKTLTTHEVESLSGDCLMVSDNIFWDRTKGQLSRVPTGPVFYRLFDTEFETEHVVKVAPFTKEQESKLLGRYEQVKEEISRGEEVERYDFLKVWANGSHDVYMDLHRAHAYMFLKKKPLGSYVLIGSGRNGKTAHEDLLHTIWGERNTSTVQLTQLGDPHYTHTLRTTLMNAPDEEDDKAVSAQAAFKTMADHGVLTLPVMRSNTPVRVVCDFMCFFPMNHTPEWKGTGANACMKRSLIIPFNADLSRFDKMSGSFAKKTFTADLLCDYLGSVFAYAYWYHRHEFVFSNTMAREQGILEQDLNSCMTYFKRFNKYFDGFESFKVVYQDYQNWCQSQDVKINSRKELKFVFRAICSSAVSVRYKKQPKKIYRLPESGKQPLMNDFNPKEAEIPDLPTLHDRGFSLIDRLDFYYEMKGIA